MISVLPISIRNQKIKNGFNKWKSGKISKENHLTLDPIYPMNK